MQIRDVRTSARVLGLNGHEDSVLAIAFSPDGSRLASASADRTLKIWDVTVAAFRPANFGPVPR